LNRSFTQPCAGVQRRRGPDAVGVLPEGGRGGSPTRRPVDRRNGDVPRDGRRI